jgi:dihydropteroate synthase
MAAGVAREAIVLDPGFGFGKGHEGDWRMLAGFEAFQELGFPLLAGVSRKGFLRRGLADAGVPGLSESEAREDATTAANTAAILGGAHILRVHSVDRARAPAAVADRLLAPDLHTAGDAP